MATQIMVHEIKQIPEERPNSWFVVFKVVFDNNREMYLDYGVRFEDAPNDADAVVFAYNNLKDTIAFYEQQFANIPSVVGRTVEEILQMTQNNNQDQLKKPERF